MHRLITSLTVLSVLGCSPTEECRPRAAASLCSAAGATCGSIRTSNGCGSRVSVECGGCTAPATCGGDGVANQCSGAPDAGQLADAGSDSGPSDAGVRPDARLDSGPPIDAGPPVMFRLTFNVRINASVDAFDAIENTWLTCNLVLHGVSTSGPPTTRFHTSTATDVACTGSTATVLDRMELNLTGQPATLTVFGPPGATNRTRFELEGIPSDEIFRIDSACDASGFPNNGTTTILAPFLCAGGDMDLTRYTGTISPGTLSDFVTAVSTIQML